MKAALVIVLLTFCARAYAATIPADANTSPAEMNDGRQDALKKRYEVLEKLLLDSQSALSEEQMPSLGETLKALTTLQSHLDLQNEEYFLGQLFQKVVTWGIKQGVSKAVAHGVKKVFKSG